MTAHPPAFPVPTLVTDSARLTALNSYAILDTVPEEGFDDIVLLATQLCQVPVALVSLVGADRQWFKARIGFPACQTDLDASVCAHALAAPDLLIIPDLTEDPRTRANPLVTGKPEIRFYAGAPLRTADGHAIGSLCVIDTVPRPRGLTAAQAGSLQALARQVMSQLELRRALAEQQSLQRFREILNRTQRAVADARGDLGAILDQVVAGALEAIPEADGAVLEFADGDMLEYRAVRGTLIPFQGLRVPIAHSLSGACFQTGEGLLVADVREDPRANQENAARMQLRACVSVPVFRGRRPVGVLKVQSRQADAFTSLHLQLVQLFAGAASTGLTEAREAAAQRAVQASETRYRAIFESAIDYAIIVLDLDGNVTNWNTGAERILGWSPEEVCGKPADVFFTPEDRAARIADKEMHSALTEGRGMDERWHLRKSGERFWANGEMMALREEDGAAIGFIKILRDRTQQRLSEERLQTADERLQMALSASGVVGLWDWMVDTDRLHGDANFARLYGLDIERTAAGLTMEEYQTFVVPEDLAPLRARIRDTFERGADFLVEYRLALPGQPLRWVECKGQLVYGSAGVAERFSGTAIDITARKTVEAEARRLAAIVEQSGDFIGVAGLDGRVAWVNEAGRRLVGLGDAASAQRTSIEDYFDPEQWPEIIATVFPAVDAQGSWRGELRFRHFVTGALIPVIYDVIALRDEGGAVAAYATVTRDITGQKRIEEQQRLLNQEITHRLKNTLAMVQAIAAQTLRNTSNLDEAREALAARLVALGQAHDVLMIGQGQGADMARVIIDALRIHDDGRPGRFVVEGPAVICGDKTALSLALMIHELATNAAKYGALRAAEGSVAITWTLAEALADPMVTFRWQEHGGPPVVPPTRKGFGSRLIERGLAGAVGGEVSMRYAPEGLVCTLVAPQSGFAG